MTERPIIFSAPMVRAILEGRKAQTRRLVKGDFKRWEEGWSLNGKAPRLLREDWCPYGVPGDRLWVREKFWNPNPRIYRAAPIYFADTGLEEHGGIRVIWKSPFHLPHWASRITLEITGVRVQRLQEISKSDICDEGWPGQDKLLDPKDKDSHFAGATQGDWMRAGLDGDDATIEWFADLWDSINGAGAWESNPWVWAIAFKRIASPSPAPKAVTKQEAGPQ